MSLFKASPFCLLKKASRVILFIICCFISFTAFASDLSSTEEKRAKALFDIVRCPVCDGQVLSGSDATIAVDLKNRIIIDIQAGKSDFEILEDLKHIYGDDILQSPPKDWRTYLLWYGPYGLIITFFGLWILRRKLR